MVRKKEGFFVLLSLIIVFLGFWLIQGGATGYLSLLGDITIEAEATSSTCGTVNSNLTLTADITTSGTCFTINTSNVIIDGAGHRIVGDTTGYGVYDSGGYYNVIIKSMVINNFDTGIYFSGGANCTVFNNSINVTNYAVQVSGTNAHDNNISSNSIATKANSGHALYFWNSDRNFIFNNMINTTAGSARAINLGSDDDFNRIFNNNITVISTSSYGIYVQ